MCVCAGMCGCGCEGMCGCVWMYVHVNLCDECTSCRLYLQMM